ncbi:MAG: serine hydrolase domain-containing protein [Pseudomonadota bacterium]
MHWLGALLISIGLVCTTPVAHPDPIDKDTLHQRLTRLMEDDAMIGLAVAVIENGEVTFGKGYGVTRIGGPPVTEETVFRWASLSKGVAATMIAKLARNGDLQLSDPISKFDTSLRLPESGETSATLVDILSHRVGIVPNAYDTTLEDGGDPKTIRTRLGNLKQTCAVGVCHTYQNVAFDSVSEVVQFVRARTYQDVVTSDLFEPLGMETASFGQTALKASKAWAAPHRKRRSDTVPVRRTIKPAYYNVPAAGGVNGSILDLATFAKAQMGFAPDIVDEAILTDLHTPRIYTRREQSGMSRRYGGHLRDARYALGWRVYKYAAPGYRVVGHRGAVDGYRSLILFDPERKSGVVALWNSNARQPVGIQFEVMDMIYGLPRQDWLRLDKRSED